MTLAATQGFAFAQSIEDKTVGKGAGETANGGSIGDTLRMLGAMAVVVVLLWVAYKVLMRMNKRGSVISGGEGKLRVLGVKGLSVKHSAVLLQAGKKVFLVGISPSGISPLGEISDENEVEELIGKKETQE